MPLKKQKQNVLLTGSKGMLGRILAPPLSKKMNVYGIDRKEESSAKTFALDLNDYQTLSKTVSEIGRIDSIVHAAVVTRKNSTWEDILKNNINATHNVFECARENKVKKVIFISSFQAFKGHLKWNKLSQTWQPKKPLSNNHNFYPVSDYGVSKASGEMIARRYFDEYRIQTICLRIGWVFENNNPAPEPRAWQHWLSHRDLIQAVEKCLAAKVGFGAYFVTSDNEDQIADMTAARKDLGFEPRDSSSRRGGLMTNTFRLFSKRRKAHARS